MHDWLSRTTSKSEIVEVERVTLFWLLCIYNICCNAIFAGFSGGLVCTACLLWTSYPTPYNSQNECNHCCNRNIFVVVVNLLHKSSHSCCVRFHCVMSYCTKLSISITNKKQNKKQKNKQKSNKKATTNKQRKENPVGSMKMHKEVGYDRMTGVKNVRSFLSSYLEKDNSLGATTFLWGSGLHW